MTAPHHLAKLRLITSRNICRGILHVPMDAKQEELPDSSALEELGYKPALKISDNSNQDHKPAPEGTSDVHRSDICIALKNDVHKEEAIEQDSSTISPGAEVATLAPPRSASSSNIGTFSRWAHLIRNTEESILYYTWPCDKPQNMRIRKPTDFRSVESESRVFLDLQDGAFFVQRVAENQYQLWRYSETYKRWEMPKWGQFGTGALENYRLVVQDKGAPTWVTIATYNNRYKNKANTLLISLV
ncbi:hypothetical protein BJ165DRAFT_1534573 [Panaeolus papilionaceus]|nr:hypothetical protein BJ165DRAFT_1534573 [Panaeolus papilionaceus]